MVWCGWMVWEGGMRLDGVVWMDGVGGWYEVRWCGCDGVLWCGCDGMVVTGQFLTTNSPQTSSHSFTHSSSTQASPPPHPPTHSSLRCRAKACPVKSAMAGSNSNLLNNSWCMVHGTMHGLCMHA